MSTKVQKKPMSAMDRQYHTNKWIFTTSGIGRDLIYQLVGTFLLTFLQFGVSLTAGQFGVLFGVIAIGGKIWDGINDPMMGSIIEGSRLKWGKFKPWILIGAIGVSIVSVFMFNLPGLGAEGWAFVIIMIILYLLWESTFTMNDIGYWSMLASLTSDTKRRNTLTMMTVLFAGVGAIIAQGLIPMVTTGNMVQGYAITAVVVAIVYMTCQAICAVFVKETHRAPAEQGEKISLKKMWKTIRGNDQVLWMTLALLFYTIGSMLLVAFIANLLYLEIGYDGGLISLMVTAFGLATVIVNILYNALANRMSRKKLQLIAVCVACVGYLWIGILGWVDMLPFNMFTMIPAAVLIGGGQSLFYTATIINITNCVEYNDYKTGQRNEAVISTLRPFVTKLADALKYGIVIVVLMASGIYTMSQSITTLEVQRSTFENLTIEQRQLYVDTVLDYYSQLEAVEEGTAEYDQLIADIGHELLTNEDISSFKLEANRIDSLANASIAVTIGDEVTKTIIKELPAGKLPILAEGATMALDIQQSANNEFAGSRDENMAGRVILRLTVTVLPVALLFGSLMVQRKRFVIDEQYYDMMMKALEQRNSAQADTPTEVAE